MGAEVVDTLLTARQTHLRVLRRVEPIAVEREGSRVIATIVAGADGAKTRLEAGITIDATEWGDLLPLAGASYRSGEDARGDTGEPDAPEVADKECAQPMTFVFYLERRPAGEDHTIGMPPGYDPNRYNLDTDPEPALDGGHRHFGVFTPAVIVPGNAPAGDQRLTFWNYRRSVAASWFTAGAPNDIAMINWGFHGNDFNRDCVALPGQTASAGCNVLERDPSARASILKRARELALGFVYWLQHDVVRDDGVGKGYPNLLLRTDETGTDDGIAQAPYVREARRAKAVTTIVEGDLASHLLPSRLARGRHYDDMIGTSVMDLDLHPCAGAKGGYIPARQAEVPLGALIPQDLEGLLLGGKAIGTTHLTNGGYRLHPAEFAVGLAAGEAAALAIERKTSPRQLRADRTALRTLQWRMVTAGHSIAWWWDVPTTHPLHAAVVMATAMGGLEGFAGNTLSFDSGAQVLRGEAATGVVLATDLAPIPACTETPLFPDDVPCSSPLYPFVQRLGRAGGSGGCAAGRFCSNDAISRGQLAHFLARAACDGKSSCLVAPAQAIFNDVPLASPFSGDVATLSAWGVLKGDPVIGTGSSFAPDAIVTREQLAIWISNLARHSFALP